MAGSKTRLILPFTLGTAFGAIGGLAVGAVLGHRVFAGLLHLWSIVGRDDDSEPKFELLLQ